MSDQHWYRYVCHMVAVAAAMSVWAIGLDFAEALAGSIVVFLIISGLADRLYGRLAGPRDIRADIEAKFGRRLDGE